MPRNNSVVGSVIGLVIFLSFGVFFLFGWAPFSFFSIVPFFPLIIIIIIIGIAVAASTRSRHSTYSSPKTHNQHQYYSQEVSRPNPYVVNASSSSTVRSISIEDDEPEKSLANFCQFCGTKKDRNSTLCHNCGSKL